MPFAIPSSVIIFSTDEFKNDLLNFGGLKPSTGRILTNFIDEFVTDFNDFVNSGIFNKYFFIHGGGLAVENALKISFDWKRHINHKTGFKVIIYLIILFILVYLSKQKVWSRMDAKNDLKEHEDTFDKVEKWATEYEGDDPKSFK